MVGLMLLAAAVWTVAITRLCLYCSYRNRINAGRRSDNRELDNAMDYLAMAQRSRELEQFNRPSSPVILIRDGDIYIVEGGDSYV